MNRAERKHQYLKMLTAAGLAAVMCVSMAACSDAASQTQSGSTGTEQVTEESDVRLVAEFEPMQGVLFVWPLNVPVELVKQVSQDAKAYIVVNADEGDTASQEKAKKELAEAGVNMDNVEFYNHTVGALGNYWIRDFGPMFAFKGGRPEVLDMLYREDEGVVGTQDFPSDFAGYLGIDSVQFPIDLQGGNFMTDGRGSAMSGSRVLEENSNDIYNVRELMNKYGGVNNYIISADPNLEDIGHVDCFAKLVAPDKVIVARVPEKDERYEAMEQIASLYAASECCWGYPYKVYRIDLPEGTGGSIEEQKEIAPYTNSLIVNKNVYMPLGSNEEYNKKAIAVYQEALPGYKIVGIEPEKNGDDDEIDTEWHNTDALHCRTHEVPDFNMVYIDHRNVYNGTIELFDEDEQDCVIKATVIAYSGKELKAGSPLLCYRIDGGKWQEKSMEKDGENSYSAKIGGVEEGSEVQYYIYAEDTDGNSNMQPVFGKDEPHSFKM